jgi:hypothetical protein
MEYVVVRRRKTTVTVKVGGVQKAEKLGRSRVVEAHSLLAPVGPWADRPAATGPAFRFRCPHVVYNQAQVKLSRSNLVQDTKGSRPRGWAGFSRAKPEELLLVIIYHIFVTTERYQKQKKKDRKTSSRTLQSTPVVAPATPMLTGEGDRGRLTVTAPRRRQTGTPIRDADAETCLRETHAVTLPLLMQMQSSLQAQWESQSSLPARFSVPFRSAPRGHAPA